MNASRWRDLLGYGGLIPFLGLALIAWLAPAEPAAFAVRAQLAYGAVILSFVGALHWGRSLRPSESASAGVTPAERAPHQANPNNALIWSVMPSLWAWLALLAPSRPGLIVMAAGIAIAWAVDQRLYQPDRGQPWQPGFLRLRAHLSATAVAALLLTAAAPSAGAG